MTKAFIENDMKIYYFRVYQKDDLNVFHEFMVTNGGRSIHYVLRENTDNSNAELISYMKDMLEKWLANPRAQYDYIVRPVAC